MTDDWRDWGPKGESVVFKMKDNEAETWDLQNGEKLHLFLVVKDSDKNIYTH